MNTIASKSNRFITKLNYSSFVNNKYIVRYNTTFNNNNNQYNNDNSNRNYSRYGKDQKQDGKWNLFDIRSISTIASAATMILVPAIILCEECFEEHEDHIVQIKTGYKYPKKLINKEHNIEYSIVNIGNRAMSFLKVNVYSMAVYIDQLDAKNKLKSQVEDMEESQFLKERSNILEKMLDDGVGMSVKLRPTKKVTWSHIYNGFESSLSKLLWRKYRMELEEMENMMAVLKEVMPRSTELNTTSELDFIRTKSGELLVLHDQKILKKIEDTKLCSTFFEFYLGDYSKVPEVREDFFQHLYSVLKDKNERDISHIGIH